MTLDELHKRAVDAMHPTKGIGWLTLILPSKRPPGFPRGELMCDNGRDKVYRVDAKKVLKWLKANGYGLTGNGSEK